MTTTMMSVSKPKASRRKINLNKMPPDRHSVSFYFDPLERSSGRTDLDFIGHFAVRL